MGTRQELGLLILVLLISLPAGWGRWLDPSRWPGQPADCRVPFEIGGEVDRPGLVCLPRGAVEPAQLPSVGLDGDCQLPAELPVGHRLVLEASSTGACRWRIEPMSGTHRLLVGLGIDPNTAGAADLEAIPGIGPVLAERIIRKRVELGGFRRLEDLIEVRGIGPKTLSKISPFIQIEQPASKPQAGESRAMGRPIEKSLH